MVCDDGVCVCAQTSVKRAASRWTTCQLTRWPKLYRLWFSPNLEPPRRLEVVQSRIDPPASFVPFVCKCVDINKPQYD